MYGLKKVIGTYVSLYDILCFTFISMLAGYLQKFALVKYKSYFN